MGAKNSPEKVWTECTYVFQKHPRLIVLLAGTISHNCHGPPEMALDEIGPPSLHELVTISRRAPKFVLRA